MQAVDRAIAQLTGGDGGAVLEQPQQTADPVSLDVLLLAKGSGSDVLLDGNKRREIAAAIASLILDADFPRTCHVLNSTTGVCSAPLSPFMLDYDARTLPDDIVALDYDPQVAWAGGTSPVPRVRLASSPVPGSSLLGPDTNASTARQILFRYANPEEAASRGMILEAEVPLYSSLRTLFFDRDFGRVLEEGEGELEEQRARGEDYGVSLKSRFLRLRMAQGMPLEGFANEEDRPREQQLEWGELMGETADETNMDRFKQDPAPEGVELVLFSGAIMEREFERRAIEDMYWAGASMLFVFLYTWFHTGSIVLAAAGLFIIFSAMPIGIFIYRLVFQIPYVYTLHGMSIFILLGLSADAVFLVQDSYQQAPDVTPAKIYQILFRMDQEAWATGGASPEQAHGSNRASIPSRQGSQGAKRADDDSFTERDEIADARQSRAEEEALVARIAYTWSRASTSLTVTTLTTIVAFLATAGSRIMPVSTFGIFAATIVFANYCLALSLYPAAIVLWEQNMRPCEAACARVLCGCCCAGASSQEAAELQTSGSVDSIPSANASSTVVSQSPMQSSSGITTASSREQQKERQGQEPQSLPMPGYQAGLFLLSTSEKDGHAEPKVERPIEIFFRDYWSEWIYVARFPILAAFAVLLGVFAYLATQLEPLTQQEQWFPESFYAGAALAWLDDEFQVTERDSTVEADITWGVAGINRDGTSRYKPANPGRAEWDESFDMSSPAAQQAILDTCFLAPAALGRVPKNEELPLYKANVSCFMQDYADWLRDEQGISFPFVASDTSGAATAEQYRDQFMSSLQTFTTSSTRGKQLRATHRIGFNADGQLRMAQVAISLNLLHFEPYDINKPIRDRMQAFVDARNAVSPPGVDGAIQTAGVAWGWMHTERELLRTALQGIGISLAVATLVLVFSTTNVIVGGLAALSMGGILVVVLGTFSALGWQMGLTESIGSIILLGFSVDYTVHSAVHFVTSNKPKAHLRVKDSLRDMGVSIVAGAITTGGAGLFLWGGIIIFFTKFATTLTVAIAVSLLFSLAFLPAALCVLGPDGDTGSILPAMQALGLGFLCGLHSEIDSDKGRRGRRSGAVAVVGAEAQNDAPVQGQSPRTSTTAAAAV